MANKKKKKPSNDGPERNSKGQFVKGNSGGPGGNKMSEHRKALRAAFDKAITEKDIKAVVKKMVEQARNGDPAARKEMLDRLWGRPQQVLVGNEDGGPLTVNLVVRKYARAKS